jgi:hypothetical protein
MRLGGSAAVAGGYTAAAVVGGRRAATMLQVAPDLFTDEQILKMPGRVRMPVRMTVVRLRRGDLLVHSPLALTRERLSAVIRLDAVAYVVAPSLLHHRFAGAWVARLPGAKLFGPPGLARKRKDLRLAGVLDGADDRTSPWGADLEHILIAGVPRISETVFFHRPTATLIVSDLLFNILHPANLPTKLLLSFTGTRGHLAMSRVWRRYTKDRKALRASLEQVLSWPFERIVPGHGEIVDGPDAVSRARHALAWGLGN